MTTATAPTPTPRTSVVLARGFLTGGVIGTSVVAFFIGSTIENWQLCLAALGLPAVYGLLRFLAGAPRRAREAAVPPRTALAMIESLKAVGGESSDVPVQFDLTVAPDDAPAFRVEIKQDINLVELPDYRPQGILVVQYPPDRPWRVRIMKRPTPEWEDRVAGARLDSAPGPAVAKEQRSGEGGCVVGFVGLLLGAVGVFLLFRGDVSDYSAAARQADAKPSVSSTSSTTAVSSASGTVALGPGQSFLDKGELRRAVDSLTKGEDKGRALTVVVQERLLSVVFAPIGTRVSGFDPSAVPYDRFPALVEDARTSLGIRSPRSWQITVDHLTGSLTVRVGVTGTEGAASLEANGDGEVVRRTPAH